ncbi:MAG: ATP-binding protein [bacterium]
MKKNVRRTKHTFKIRPYARLLTMLGEQLIKNEQIALTELIKNSYDADATWVKISFIDFGENLELLQESKIIIEDNGVGMSLNTIKNDWMNPATPSKFSHDGNIKKTPSGKRIIQGEKGIGRFAILKLGRKIQITTREKNSNEENIIDYDLSAFDDNFLTEEGERKDLFLDDLRIRVYTKKPSIIVNKPIQVDHRKFIRESYGTRIEVTNLKGKWTLNKINRIYNDLAKLESIFDKIANKNREDNFDVGLELNGKRQTITRDYIEKVAGIFENKSVFRITEGEYNHKQNAFYYKINDVPKALSIKDVNFRKVRVYRERFQDNKTKEYREPECHSFKFNLFIFDFEKQAPLKYKLDSEDRNIIRNHRVYLYRDGIRVIPYGDPDDDWLKIDTLRGTIAVGHFFSNDQIVGFIEISKHGNPELKDKTNREGLIEEGNATLDFIGLIQSFLSYLRLHPYQQYKIDNQNRNAHDLFRNDEVKNKFELLKKQFSKDKNAQKAIENLYTNYSIERKYLTQRVEATEDLASVGLSVETASHDIMMMLGKGLHSLDDLIRDCIAESISLNEISEELQKLKGIFSFVESQMKDVQLLFKSSKQRRRQIPVKEILDKVIRIYKRTLKRNKIEYNINEIGSPLIAKCTDAVLLQLFINLFDNSIFWLSDTDLESKKILITLNGHESKMIFSDNGPGIKEEYIPYIFEPFYSAKEEGRGLGLYIARQLLERNDYSIELADIQADKLLPGANFVTYFIAQ